MKTIKNKSIIFLTFLSLFFMINVCFSNKVYAAEDAKLNTFIATSIDKGYLNSTLEISQVSNHKYKVDFLVKENILGINYGFYLTPTIIESLTNVGFECETFVDEQYAYSVFSITTKNLGEVANKISILPYIDLEYYIDEDSKEQILKGTFQEDFFKEERKSNKMLNTLFESNLITFKFKPISESLLTSNAPLKDKDNFYLWIYSKNHTVSEFSCLIKPVPVYIYAFIYICFFLIILLIAYSIYYFTKKKKNNNRFDNEDYLNSDYTDYNNYNY